MVIQLYFGTNTSLTQMKKRTKTTKIILHCSATPEGKDYKAANIDRWHKNQKWEMIGYHYVVDLDGTIEEGRPIDMVGAHCSGYNSESIGICYIGGCDKNMKAKDTRTDAQKISLYKVVYEMMKKYNLDLTNVYCHNQFSNKQCPSFDIGTFKKEYLEWQNKPKTIICPHCGNEIPLVN